MGEVIRLDLAKNNVAVSYRQGAASTIAGGAGVGSGRCRADPVSGPVKIDNRSAPGSDGMNMHHRRTHPHSRYHGLEASLKFPVVMGDISGCPAHIKTDEFGIAGHGCRLDHADNTAGRAGKDGILALEQLGIGQAAVGLHKHQFRAGIPGAAELLGDLVDITPQNRRKIGVDNGGIPPGDQFHQGTYPVADRNLGKTDFLRDLGNHDLMLRIPKAMHKNDGHRTDTMVICILHAPLGGLPVQRGDDFAMGGNPFLDLEYLPIEHFRQNDMAGKEVGTGLVADAQSVTEAPGGHQKGRVAFSFEQGVGGDRGAHFDCSDYIIGNWGGGIEVQEVAYTLDGRVLVFFRIFRKQFMGDEAPIWFFGHYIGKGAATINPYLPLGHYLFPVM